MIAAALAGMVFAPSAGAVSPGENGRIYGAYVNPTGNILTAASVLPDGTGVRDEPVLFTGDGRPIRGGLSHSGRTFLQSSADPVNGAYGLRELPLDTPVPKDILPRGGIGLLDSFATGSFVAAYSTDDSQVIFVGTETADPFRQGVYAVDVDGTAVPRLLFELFAGSGAPGTVDFVQSIAASPTDASQLLMVRAYNTPGSCLAVDEIDLLTGQFERHVTNAVGPHCAGSAHRFDYVAGGDAILMISPFFHDVPSNPHYDHAPVRHVIASGADTPLVDPIAVATFEASSQSPPLGSPDGAEVAYDTTSPENDVAVITITGLQRRKLGGGLRDAYFWAPTAPSSTVTIDSGPPGLSRSKSATFTFSAAGSPSGQFECRLDGAAPAPCVSGVTFTDLADGDHTFSVRFLPSVGSPSAPTQVGWRVDTVTPVTVLESGPSGTENAQDAEIRFSSTATDLARFECSLDGGPGLPCESPLRLSVLAPGLHRLLISAVDLAGNVENPPVELVWSVAGPPPPPVNCPTPVASAGVLSGKALNESACWAQDTIDGVAALASEGPVSVNGIRIDPKPGTRILISQQLAGGALRVTGPSRVSLGAAGIDIDRPIGWDGVSQGALVTVNKALETLDKKFGGLPITAPPSLELSAENGGQTKLTLKLQLPASTFSALPGRPANAEAQKGALVAVDISITTSNDLGVTGGGKITVPELWLFGRIKLRDLSVGYDGATGLLEGTVGVELATLGILPPKALGKDATIAVGIALGPDGFAGPIRKLGVKFDGLEKHLSHGVFLQRLAADAAAGTDAKKRPTIVLSGTVGSSFLAKKQFLGLLEAEPLSMDGKIALSILASPSTADLANEAPWGVEITGEGKLVDIPIGNASLTFDPTGKLVLKGRQELSAFGFGISADITEAYFDPLRLDLGVRARGAARFPGLGETDAEVAASTAGIAVCARMLGGSRVGFGKRFTSPPEELRMFAGGCDVGPFTAGAAASAAGDHVVQVQEGRRLLVLAVRGRDTAPKVTVDGPGGTHIVTPAGATGIRNAKTLLVQAPEARTTFVLIRDPAPGRWTVTGDGIASVRTAAERPPVRVSATVRKGRLHWQLRRQPGLRVTFIERGPRTARTIVTTTRARGSVRYKPAPTRDRQRRIVAEVVQDGLPRETRTVARVNVTPPRIGPIRGLKVTRTKATWKAQAAATSYAVALLFADGRTRTLTVRKPSVSLKPGVPASVTVVAIGADGRAGTSTAKRVPKR